METLTINNLTPSTICVVWNNSVDNDIEAFDSVEQAQSYIASEKEFDSTYDLDFMWIEDAQNRIKAITE